MPRRSSRARSTPVSAWAAVSVYRGNELIGRVALVTAAEVPGAGVFRILTSVLGVPLTLLVLVGIFLAAGLRLRTVGRRKVTR